MHTVVLCQEEELEWSDRVCPGGFYHPSENMAFHPTDIILNPDMQSMLCAMRESDLFGWGQSLVIAIEFRTIIELERNIPLCDLWLSTVLEFASHRWWFLTLGSGVFQISWFNTLGMSREIQNGSLNHRKCLCHHNLTTSPNLSIFQAWDQDHFSHWLPAQHTLSFPVSPLSWCPLPPFCSPLGVGICDRGYWGNSSADF